MNAVFACCIHRKSFHPSQPGPCGERGQSQMVSDVLSEHWLPGAQSVNWSHVACYWFLLMTYAGRALNRLQGHHSTGTRTTGCMHCLSSSRGHWEPATLQQFLSRYGILSEEVTVPCHEHKTLQQTTRRTTDKQQEFRWPSETHGVHNGTGHLSSSDSTLPPIPCMIQAGMDKSFVYEYTVWSQHTNPWEAVTVSETSDTIPHWHSWSFQKNSLHTFLPYQNLHIFPWNLVRKYKALLRLWSSGL
jgi:hypothetical protein